MSTAHSPFPKPPPKIGVKLEKRNDPASPRTEENEREGTFFNPESVDRSPRHGIAFRDGIRCPGASLSPAAHAARVETGPAPGESRQARRWRTPHGRPRGD